MLGTEPVKSPLCPFQPVTSRGNGIVLVLGFFQAFSCLDLSKEYKRKCEIFFKEIETNNKEYKRKTKVQQIREGVFGRVKQRTQFKIDERRNNETKRNI